MQIRGDWGKVSVAWSMTRRRNCKLYLWRWWGMNGRWECAGAHSMCPVQHGLFWWKRIPNHHMRISSPQGSGWVAPPQASPFPLWPLILTDLPLTGLASSIQRLHLWVRSCPSVPEIPPHLLWTPTGTTITEDGLCANFRSTVSTGMDIRTLVLPMLTRMTFLPCYTSRWSSSLANPPAIHRWWTGYLYAGFSGASYTKLTEEASSTVMNRTGPRQEPWWTPTFSRNSHVAINMHSGSCIFIHALYEMHQPLLNACVRRSYQMTYVWAFDRMPFPDRQKSCTASCWPHGTFLEAGVQRIWRRWCRIQAWSQTACHPCTLVVEGSSLPPALAPPWSGLAT